MKYTKGPWEIWPAPHGHLTIYAGETRSSIAATHSATNEMGNAKLLAAAPELLEALQRTLDWLASYPGGGPMSADGPYEQARAAIKKATGEA